MGRGGTPASYAALLDICTHRAPRLGLEPGAYAARLEADPSEALAALDVYHTVRPWERGFFQDMRVFEELQGVVREWSRFRGRKTLTAVILGCGRGWQCVSLAASLSAAGLLGKGWEVSMAGMDVSPKALEEASLGLYAAGDMPGFVYPEKLWFSPRAGGIRHFSGCGGLELEYLFGDPYLPWDPAPEKPGAPGVDRGPAKVSHPAKASPPGNPPAAGKPPAAEAREERDGGAAPSREAAAPAAGGFPGLPRNRLADFAGRVDVLMCRNISREAPDGMSETLPRAVSGLLAEGGLAFAGPGEIWPPPEGMALEERNGVFYYRKAPARRKAANFFAPLRGREAAGAPPRRPAAPAGSFRDGGGAAPGNGGPDGGLPGAGATGDGFGPASAAPDAGGRRQATLRMSGEAVKRDPGRARELARKAIAMAAEDMECWPAAYEALAAAEEALGRPGFAVLVREAMALYGG
jgi:chemotaxis methyl-accepting protein methylase